MGARQGAGEPCAGRQLAGEANRILGGTWKLLVLVKGEQSDPVSSYSVQCWGCNVGATGMLLVCPTPRAPRADTCVLYTAGEETDVW